MGILELLIMAGALGTFVGALLVNRRKVRIVETVNDPSVVRDSSNPYAPSNVTTHVVTERAGNGRQVFWLLAFAGVMLGIVLTFAASKTKTVGIPLPRPPKLLPQPTPPAKIVDAK